ncbi:EamA family transporter [Azospirillum sp. YIM B02556]|uniref:EamA family transporter n=1 Tax=Azospirillum endophyticum TaxID=2800326 RepID=A0ABS1EY04_9PROT|nr:EamA family transporter [Azospirillum endophyticum]MBK1836034.1 EamA family transporter [Azospirillum endophyticum]
MVYYVCLGISILLGVGGQILLKQGAIDGQTFVAQMLRPHTVGGLALYVVSALLYLVALRRLPVSVAFPSVSLSYVAVAVLGNLAFHEPLGLPQLGGIALIVGGVVLLAWT